MRMCTTTRTVRESSRTGRSFTCSSRRRGVRREEAQRLCIFPTPTVYRRGQNGSYLLKASRGRGRPLTSLRDGERKCYCCRKSGRNERKAEVDPVGPGRDESLCVFSVSASRWEKRNTHNRSRVKKTDRDTQRPACVLF